MRTKEGFCHPSGAGHLSAWNPVADADRLISKLTSGSKTENTAISAMIITPFVFGSSGSLMLFQ